MVYDLARAMRRWTEKKGSIPRWSASETQDHRPAERQRGEKMFIHWKRMKREQAQNTIPVLLGRSVFASLIFLVFTVQKHRKDPKTKFDSTLHLQKA